MFNLLQKLNKKDESYLFIGLQIASVMIFPWWKILLYH